MCFSQRLSFFLNYALINCYLDHLTGKGNQLLLPQQEFPPPTLSNKKYLCPKTLGVGKKGAKVPVPFAPFAYELEQSIK